MDACVCYLCRDLDLYGADEEDKRRAFIQENEAQNAHDKNDDKTKNDAKEKY